MEDAGACGLDVAEVHGGDGGLVRGEGRGGQVFVGKGLDNGQDR